MQGELAWGTAEFLDRRANAGNFVRNPTKISSDDGGIPDAYSKHLGGLSSREDLTRVPDVLCGPSLEARFSVGRAKKAGHTFAF